MAREVISRKQDSSSTKQPASGSSVDEMIFRESAAGDDASGIAESNSFITGTIDSIQSITGPLTKLEVGESDDPLEKEADEVAEKVVSSNEDGSMQDTVRLKTEGASSSTESSPASESGMAGVSALGGSGRSLPRDTRSFFESRMNTDLSGVRIHDNSASDAMARRLGAKAFSVGKDVGFKDGCLSLHDHDGLKLVAHELAHVIQDNSTVIRRQSEDTNSVEVAGGEPESQETDSSFDDVVTHNNIEKEWKFDGDIDFGEGVKGSIKIELKIVASSNGDISVEAKELGFKIEIPKVPDIEFSYAPDKQVARFGVSYRGMEVALSNEGNMERLTLAVDILELMYGSALEKLKPILGIKSKFGVDVDLGDDFRIEKAYMNLGLEVGPEVKFLGTKTSSRLGLSLDIETDYASGRGDDDLDRTTAVGELYYEQFFFGLGGKETIFIDKGEAYGGGIQQSIDKEFKIITNALRSAYWEVYDKMVALDYSGKGVAIVERDLNSKTKEKYETRRRAAEDEFAELWLPPRTHFKIYDRYVDSVHVDPNFSRSVRLLKMADEYVREVDRVIRTA